MTKTKHEIKNDDWNRHYAEKVYTTGADVNFVVNYHKFELPTNKLILDVGVGYGNFVKEMSETNTMIGVDVSQVALDNARPYCKEVYLSEDLNKIEPVDFAVCNLVLQHNDEYEVTRIINDVNLKDDAIFSFQFSSLNPQKTQLNATQLDNINHNMLYFYAVDKMKTIVDRTNKKVVDVIGPYWFPQPYSWDWYVFRVVNK